MGLEMRREPRYAVVITGNLRNASLRPQVVQVTNLSASGCRLESERRLGQGDFITLKIGPIGPLDAKVAWRDADAHGIEFEGPLHAAVLDHMRLFLSENPALYAEGEAPEPQ